MPKIPSITGSTTASRKGAAALCECSRVVEQTMSACDVMVWSGLQVKWGYREAETICPAAPAASGCRYGQMLPAICAAPAAFGWMKSG